VRLWRPLRARLRNAGGEAGMEARVRNTLSKMNSTSYNQQRLMHLKYSTKGHTPTPGNARSINQCVQRGSAGN
jgi:hypothetical protein